MPASAAIASLAVLRVNYDARGWDYIDNFVVFAAEALRACGGGPADLTEVRRIVADKFGLSLPAGVVKTVLHRACDRGLAKSAGRDRYEPILPKIDELGFARSRDSALRQTRALSLRLIAFSKSVGNGLSTEEAAEQALLDYVTAGSPALLPAIVSAGLPPPGGTSANESLLHEFVVLLHRSDPEGYGYLETIVKGAFLRSAAYVPDLGRVQARFDRLDVYLDTRLLLRALGLAGPVQEGATRELLDLTYELGGVLRCFDHTLLELTRVLTSVAASLRSRSAYLATTSETLEYLSSIGFRQSDVDTVISELPGRLAGLRITTTARPVHVAAYTIDEAAVGKTLKAGAAGSYRDEAVDHDVDAITAIYRLRRGQRMPVLESARAIFVTTNQLLVRTAADYFDTNSRTRSTPLALTEHEFATIAWLKKPTSAPNLPAGMVIADSYAALNPPERVWHAYLEEIAKLEASGDISEDEYFALRFSTSAKAALWGMTKGRPEAISRASIPAILARVRESIAAEVAPRLIEEGRREALSATEKELAEWKRRATEAELETDRLRSEREAQRLMADARVQSWAHGIGRWTSRVVFVPLALVIAVMTWIGLGSWMPALPVSPDFVRLLQPLAPVAAVVTFLVVMALTFVGGSIGDWRRTLEVAAARRSETFLRRISGVE